MIKKVKRSHFVNQYFSGTRTEDMDYYIKPEQKKEHKYLHSSCKQNNHAQKTKFSNKDFFSKWDQICRKLNLVTFFEEVLDWNVFSLVQCNDLKSESTPKAIAKNITNVAWN